MKIYRHKENGLLYTIEHVVQDLHHLNNNGFAGIHPNPFGHTCAVENFYSKKGAECAQHVANTFEVVSE
jgi:hypothetical protein